MESKKSYKNLFNTISFRFRFNQLLCDSIVTIISSNGISFKSSELMKSEIDFTIDTLKVFLSTHNLQYNSKDILQIQVPTPNDHIK